MQENKSNIISYQKKLLLIPVFFSFMSFNVHALPLVSGVAQPPHRIKSNTPTFQATGLTPTIIRNAYGFNQLAWQGEGQVIGIIDAYDDPNIEADLAVFDTILGSPDCTQANGCFSKIYAAGSKPSLNANWAVEISLDVEWAHAIAPKAKILLVEAANNSYNALFDAINVAINNGATVISMSWGGNEFPQETAFDQA